MTLIARPANDRERVIVALDVPTVGDARVMTRRLGETAVFYKIGMRLIFSGGLELARELMDQGKHVFLDAKLFDIEATVAHAVDAIAALGVRFLTIHGNGPTIAAAARARAKRPLGLLSVTVLTNLDAADMAQLGFENLSIEELALYRAKAALAAGADGVVTSGREAQAVKAAAGDKLVIVTPGIRPGGSTAHDQKRIVTPVEAIRNGADYLVIGRPVLEADDPVGILSRIIDDIARVAR